MELKVFESPEFGAVRTVMMNGEPWFVGKDVAEILGYSNSRKALADHVDEEDKGVTKCDTLGGAQDLAVINESGLYSLIFGSKLDSAKRFKRWITSEVLPSLRKYGTYTMTDMNGISDELKAILMHDKKLQVVEKHVDEIDEDLQNFKLDMPILGIEESKITSAVKEKGTRCLGGKDSKAYKNRSLRRRLYADIYANLKHEFGVGTYKAIKRSTCDQAVSIVQKYEPPLALSSLIMAQIREV